MKLNEMAMKKHKSEGTCELLIDWAVAWSFYNIVTRLTAWLFEWLQVWLSRKIYCNNRKEKYWRKWLVQCTVSGSSDTLSVIRCVSARTPNQLAELNGIYGDILHSIPPCRGAVGSWRGVPEKVHAMALPTIGSPLHPDYHHE